MDNDRYADTLANWAEFFHHYDPEAAIVGVGSSEGLDAEWDRTVLDRAGAQLDLLSLHVYAATVVGEADARRAGLVQFPVYVEQRITAMAELIREHNRQYGRRVGIAVDEWNIRHWRPAGDDDYVLDRADRRTGSDALCAAGFFHAMIKNADVVRMANYVFLVNGNGVLDARDGQCRPTTLATIFRAYRELMNGAAVPVTVHGPQVPLAELCSGDPRPAADRAPQRAALAALPPTVPAIDAAACRNADGIRLSMINRCDQPIQVDLSAVHDQSGRISVDRFVVDTATEELSSSRTESAPVLTLPPWSAAITRDV
jgi:alpha-N-arabinofuranosidase